MKTLTAVEIASGESLQLAVDQAEYVKHILGSLGRRFGAFLIQEFADKVLQEDVPSRYPMWSPGPPKDREYRLELMVGLPSEYRAAIEKARAEGHREGYARGQRVARENLRQRVMKNLFDE